MTDFARTRAMFHLPDGLIYLDGNSLGPLPLNAVARARDLMQDQWGQMLIGGWNKAGWMDLSVSVGDRIGRLIRAAPGSVIVGDTLSIKLYQALASALELRPDRRIVLSDSGNFPSDLYMAQGLLKSLGGGHVLKTPKPESVEAMIDDTIAVVMLTEVDYRTGRLHDMRAITRKAHEAGAMMIWDLAHSAGALPIDLAGANADFAVGCTYKYLNGGPGAPAFIYVRPDLHDQARPALSGWLGHEAPFAFAPDYRPARGIERMRVGTPPVIALAVLDAAMDAWDGVDMTDLRACSIELTELFIAEVQRRCPQVELASPRGPLTRGSQISFRHPQGYAAMQALIERRVIGDFRAPDIMRFGFTPLYIGEQDVVGAAKIMAEIFDGKLWDKPAYRKMAAVT